MEILQFIELSIRNIAGVSVLRPQPRNMFRNYIHISKALITQKAKNICLNKTGLIIKV